MRAKVTVDDNSKAFIRRNLNMLDRVAARGVQDIAMLTSGRIPRKSGNLMDRIETKKVDDGHHQVVIDEDYAAYQERGMRADGSRKVRKYTSAGTGPHALEKSGNQIASKLLAYIKKAASRV